MPGSDFLSFSALDRLFRSLMALRDVQLAFGRTHSRKHTNTNSSLFSLLGLTLGSRLAWLPRALARPILPRPPYAPAAPSGLAQAPREDEPRAVEERHCSRRRHGPSPLALSGLNRCAASLRRGLLGREGGGGEGQERRRCLSRGRLSRPSASAGLSATGEGGARGGSTGTHALTWANRCRCFPSLLLACARMRRNSAREGIIARDVSSHTKLLVGFFPSDEESGLTRN